MSILSALALISAPPVEMPTMPPPTMPPPAMPSPPMPSAVVECPAMALGASPARAVILTADDVQGIYGPIIQVQIPVSASELAAFGRLNFLRLDGQPFAGGLMSRRLGEDGQTSFIVSFERDMVTIFAKAVTLELVEKDGPGLKLVLAGADAGPLADCLTANAVPAASPLGVRRSTFVAISPNQPLQIRSRSYYAANYPPRALQEEREGETRIRFAIGTDGRVAKCDVMISSGHADLDGESCRAARMLTYFPAANAAGEPIETMAEQRIKWEIPK